MYPCKLLEYKFKLIINKEEVEQSEAWQKAINNERTFRKNK